MDYAAWGILWGDSWGSSWGPLHVVEEKPWDTSQGVAPGWLKFEPLRSADVKVSTHGAYANSGKVSVEARTVTEVFVSGVCASAFSCRVEVSTSSIVRAGTSGARSGSARPYVSTSAVARIYGAGSRSGGSRVSVSGDGCVNAGSNFAGARSTPWVQCETVKNPTDEELLLFFLTS
jgi:hypothetical protein